MSIKVSSWVWEHSDLKATKLLVLLALADFCNDDGVCFPGHKHIAQKARVSKDYAGKLLDQLRDDGYIFVEVGTGMETPFGSTNRYLIRGYRESIGLETPFNDRGGSTVPPQGGSTVPPKPSVEPSDKKKKDLSPPNGSDDNTPSKTKTQKTLTTVVNFQDVKDHWDKETQTWDNDDYVYIGRPNPYYNLPESDWRNPYQVSSYTNDDPLSGRPRVSETEAREKVIDMYSTLLNSPKAIPLYNRIPELRGKTLVCWCHPEPCHGDILAGLANKKGWRPKNAWFEAVSRHFGITNGKRVGALIKMLQGTATDPSHKKYNIEPPLRSPSDLDDFMNWYHQEKPNMPLESQDTIHKNIDLWRAWKLKRVEAARPAETLHIPGSPVTVTFDTPEPLPTLTPEEEQAAREYRETEGKRLREQMKREQEEANGGNKHDRTN